MQKIKKPIRAVVMAALVIAPFAVSSETFASSAAYFDQRVVIASRLGSDSALGAWPQLADHKSFSATHRQRGSR
jgi:hypothetical protein